MWQSTVRITNIEITNFKNVGHGYLSFENAKSGYAASILGLYGQNGSGKTALIDVLELLKAALTDKKIPDRFADCINVDSDFAVIKYGFQVRNLSENSTYSAFYEVRLGRELKDGPHDEEEDPTAEASYKAVLFDEVLSCSYQSPQQNVRRSPVIDTRTESDVAFAPATKYKAFTGGNKDIETDLLVAKRLTRATSRSFIFSKEFLNQMRKHWKENNYSFLIENLIYFGRYRLFVINTTNTGLITMNALPLAFNYAEKGRASVGNLLIKLDDSSLIPEDALDIVHKVIRNMNIVLEQLVPGLTISVKNLGAQLYPNGFPGYRIQLMSHKNSKAIPLQYESDGIKKLISILQLLIVIYNKPSMTVAIDELDSGIFEYLLGEILRIVSEKGKGQLIFTSHNLRPLETLDKGFIAFTTTNPQNRYIRMTNVKTTNNLRSFYYRDIMLGEQSEPVYDPTNNYEIALAFREAGVSDGT